MKDETVRQKLDGMSPLAGGIVFGKEEAWDKLQARMDKPAAKVVPLWYRLAAAAILLLFITIAGIWYRPSTEIVKQDTKTQQNNNVTQAVAKAQPGTNVLPEVAPVPLTKRPAKKNSHTAGTVHKQHEVSQPETNTARIQPPVPEQIVPTEMVANTSPAPVKKQMKVVHVNDADEQLPVAIVAVNPTPLIRKGLVVHLNDVTAQQQAIDGYVKRRGDNIAVSIPFLNGQSKYTLQDNTEQNTAHNPLKFKIN